MAQQLRPAARARDPALADPRPRHHHVGDWADSKQWISSALEFAVNPIGTYFDPDKLVQAREQGLGFEEIHRRARAGAYLPDDIPEDIFLPDLY